MAGITYGYVRVSTQEQNEARQLAAMQEFGVAEENIVVEKLSGKDFCRPRYQRLLAILRYGGALAGKSIDRLGRNYMEILERWSATVILPHPVYGFHRLKPSMWKFCGKIFTVGAKLFPNPAD